MTVPEIQHVSYEPGSLVLVRSANVVALVDDSDSPPDALNALIGAATLGDYASLESLASGDASKFASLAMLLKGDDGWQALLYGQLGCQLESASSVTLTTAKPGQLHSMDLGDNTMVALYPAGGTAPAASNAVEVPSGAVRANGALIDLGAIPLADRGASVTVSESPVVQVAAVVADAPAQEVDEADVEADEAEAPKTARMVLPTADTEPPPAPTPPAAPPTPAAATAPPVAPAPAPTPTQAPAAPVEVSDVEVSDVERSLPPVGPGVAAVSEGTSTLFRPPQSANATPQPPGPSAAPVGAPPAPASGNPPPPQWASDGNVVDLNAPGVPERPALAVEGPTAATADTADDREPVQVLGVRCPVDHHNHPNAVYCAQCGRRMGVNQTAVAQPGPRPPLGLFLLGDGSSFSIASDMVIGRDPSGHVDVTDHGADVLRLSDERAEISRAHVGIYLDNWSVTAIDLESANGTQFKAHDGDDWMPLGTDSRVVLHAGDTLRVGGHELRVELHHVQS